MVGFLGRLSNPSSSSSVSLRPCVSTTPATTSTPSFSFARAEVNISYVLPTPGAAPRKILRRPPAFASRLCSANRASGDGRFPISPASSIINTPACSAGLLYWGSMGCGTVEREIKRKNVDTGLAQDTKQSSLRMLIDELTDAILRPPARLGDARDLEQRPFRRNMGIEPASRGGNQVLRYGRARILRHEFLDIALDALNQCLVGRPHVGAA